MEYNDILTQIRAVIDSFNDDDSVKNEIDHLDSLNLSWIDMQMPQNFNKRLLSENNYLKQRIIELKIVNNRLKRELFEYKKDYLIKTADVSDKLYLKEEIRKVWREIYG